jgi:transposase-like protein
VPFRLEPHQPAGKRKLDRSAPNSNTSLSFNHGTEGLEETMMRRPREDEQTEPSTNAFDNDDQESIKRRVDDLCSEVVRNEQWNPVSKVAVKSTKKGLLTPGPKSATLERELRKMEREMSIIVEERDNLEKANICLRKEQSNPVSKVAVKSAKKGLLTPGPKSATLERELRKMEREMSIVVEERDNLEKANICLRKEQWNPVSKVAVKSTKKGLLTPGPKSATLERELRKMEREMSIIRDERDNLEKANINLRNERKIRAQALKTEIELNSKLRKQVNQLKKSKRALKEKHRKLHLIPK